jgi:hypothetical protein
VDAAATAAGEAATAAGEAVATANDAVTAANDAVAAANAAVAAANTAAEGADTAAAAANTAAEGADAAAAAANTAAEGADTAAAAANTAAEGADTAAAAANTAAEGADTAAAAANTAAEGADTAAAAANTAAEGADTAAAAANTAAEGADTAAAAANSAKDAAYTMADSAHIQAAAAESAAAAANTAAEGADTAAEGADTAAAAANTAAEGANTAAEGADAAAAAANTAAEGADTAAAAANTAAEGADAAAAILTAMLDSDWEYYYGVEWDTANPSPACTRIGNPALHVSLPIQSRMRRCLAMSSGSVSYYLNASDSTKKADGTDALLNGTDGQVMVEIPAHYRKFDRTGAKWRVRLSEYSLPGFHYVPKAYRGAYYGCVDRGATDTPKLCSVMNSGTAFRGGSNNAAWDGTYRSMLGRPSTHITIGNFIRYAANRGSKWGIDSYDLSNTCAWLYLVEYANFNVQLAFNPDVDANGYRQGGLGKGATTLDSSLWNSFNSRNIVVPCGISNSLGNASGDVTYSMPEEYGSGDALIAVACYRGLENFFGLVSNFMEGEMVVTPAAGLGDKAELYACSDRSKLAGGIAGYERRGLLPFGSYPIKTLLAGEHGDIAPLELNVGGSYSEYACANAYIVQASGEKTMVVASGGAAQDGEKSSPFNFYAGITAEESGAYWGARACYYP